jgi:uncharacterized protein (TIGR02145 family)
MRFATILCPYPWRVPTQQDFRDLDIALGGTGNNRGIAIVQDTATVTRLINDWGASFGGFSSGDGVLRTAGTQALYWSQTPREGVPQGHDAQFFVFTTMGNITMNIVSSDGTKQLGQTLRCVRDNN